MDFNQKVAYGTSSFIAKQESDGTAFLQNLLSQYL
jgi:hypothetical protein